VAQLRRYTPSTFQTPVVQRLRRARRQVETRVALGNIEAIAAVDGVDGVFIGPGDLATDLGHVGDPAHADVQAAIEDAIRRIRAAGSVAGILTGDEELAKRYLELGCLFTAVGADVGILARGTEQLAARFKKQPVASPQDLGRKIKDSAE
jgi:4-hydroxy-2-oxoheptanedioate aldolase